MLNGDRSRAGLVEVHVNQTGFPNARRKSACLPVSREIADQRIVHKPGAGAERYVPRRVSSLAACFETFAKRRHGCRSHGNCQDYQRC